MPPTRKRPAAIKIEAGATPRRPAPKKVKSDPDATSLEQVGSSTVATASTKADEALKQRFLDMFNEPTYVNGVSNSALRTKFGQADYVRLAPLINALLAESRLSMSRGGRNELFYTLVSDEMASKFAGLDVSARLVYQVIEKAGNMGIWTKQIKKETNIQNTQALNKIYKALETRRLIKPVKSISAKSKKLYMLYDLTPSTELTGGIWYSDLEFDHGFISGLRDFLMMCVEKLNRGKGVTLQEVLEKINQANVSRVNLGLNDVGQLMKTLVYDNLVEEVHPGEQQHGHAPSSGVGGDNDNQAAVYVLSRPVGAMCDFKMWADVLSPDFHFRNICFEDGVTLKPHEPHYHS